MNDEEEDGLTEEDIEEAVAGFVEDLTGHIDDLKERRWLRKSPSDSQINKLKALARKAMIESGDTPDPEQSLRITCPDCYQPVLTSHPDHGEEAIAIACFWTDSEEYDTNYLNISDCEFEDLSVQDLLKKPKPEQVAEALKTLPSRKGGSDNEVSENRALLRALVQLYPDLVKQTAKAQAYFNPTAAAQKPSPAAKKSNPKGKKKKEGGCLASLVGLATIVFVIWMIYKALT
jgi:hypothetical protein